MVGYEDVGGCARQMAAIQELVELPLRQPNVFETIGVEVQRPSSTNETDVYDKCNRKVFTFTFNG